MTHQTYNLIVIYNLTSVLNKSWWGQLPGEWQGGIAGAAVAAIIVTIAIWARSRWQQKAP